MTKNDAAKPARILIVEDEGIIAMDLRQEVITLGYAVCGTVRKTEEALEIVEQERPDLILMDIVLAGAMDGIRAAEVIREKHHTPVIFITAYADREYLEQAKLTYPFGYILKPFQPRELAVTIKMALFLGRVETEKRKAMAALGESEKLLRTIAANYPNSYLSIIEKDLTLGFTAGQEFTKQNLDPGSFVGLTLGEVFGEQTGVVREKYLKTFQGEETSFELLFNDQWQLYRTVPLYDDHGQIHRILAVVENITERKRIEAETAARVGISQIFLKSASVETIYREVAECLVSYLGFPIAAIESYHPEEGEMEFVGGAGMPGIPTGLRVPVDQTLSGIVAAGGSEICESRADRRPEYGFEALKRLGVQTFICVPLQIGETVIGTLALADQKERKEAACWVANLKTVAASLSIHIQRKQAEESLRKSEHRLRETNQILLAVLEHTHMMAAYLDERFNFIWVNRAYAETCNHEPSFFPGKNHFDLYPQEDNQAIFQRVVDTGKPFFVEAKPFTFPDQPERGVTYWDWSLIPVKGDDGNVTGLVFTLAEVTARILGEAALREMRVGCD